MTISYLLMNHNSLLGKSIENRIQDTVYYNQPYSKKS